MVKFYLIKVNVLKVQKSHKLRPEWKLQRNIDSATVLKEEKCVELYMICAVNAYTC